MSVLSTVKLLDAVEKFATKLPDDQSPLSSTSEPAPTISVVEEYPENAKVCPVANADIVTEELSVLAFDGSVIVAEIAVLFEDTDNEVFPTKLVYELERTDKELLTSPIAEIAVVFTFILF